MVQGHIDGMAEVRAIRTAGQYRMELAAAAELTDPMVPKGSVCLDGVSLTLVEVSEGRFSVAMIPTTLAETTLGGLKVGSKVNVETDVIGKYIRKYLEQDSAIKHPDGGVTLEKLQEEGFL